MASDDNGGLESVGHSRESGELRHEEHQALIFGSGSRMTRELFRELSSNEGPSGLSAFQALMQASVALAGRRAGIIATMSRGTQPDPVELLSLWLDAHALGHLALLAYRLDAL